MKVKSRYMMGMSACKTCGSYPTDVIDVDGAYAVAHFCDDYDTIVVRSNAETPDAVLIRWNADNAL